MARRRVRGIVADLAASPAFRSWRDLPPGFVIECAGLRDDEVLDLATRLWRR